MPCGEPASGPEMPGMAPTRVEDPIECTVVMEEEPVGCADVSCCCAAPPPATHPVARPARARLWNDERVEEITRLIKAENAEESNTEEHHQDDQDPTCINVAKTGVSGGMALPTVEAEPAEAPTTGSPLHGGIMDLEI